MFLLLGLGGIQAAAFSNQYSLAAAAHGSDNDGAQAVNRVASIEQLLYISASMGLSLLVSVWLFYRYAECCISCLASANTGCEG
jgi:aquaporin related protein